MSAPAFARIAFIGIGLIGSSLARVLRRESPQTALVACARRAETLAAVERLGLADAVTDDPAAAVAGADLVVLATPLSAYAAIGRRIAPDTFVNDAIEERAHPHCYCDAAGLVALFAGFELLSLVQRLHKKPGSWHWHILAERRPG